MKIISFTTTTALGAMLLAALPAAAAFGDVDPTFHTATFEGFTCRNSPTLLGNDSMLVHLWDHRTTSSDPAFRHAIAKVKPDGSVDRTFGRDGLAEFVAPNNALNLMPLGDGRILAVGNRATRLLADGSVDTSYGQGGSTEEFFPFYRIAGATLLPDGSLIVASQPSPDVQFTWFRPDGRRATEFGLDGRLSGFRRYSTFGPEGVIVYAWSLQADGSVHMGYYSSYNSTPRVTRYRYDPSPPGGMMTTTTLPGVMPAAGIASWTSNAVKVDGFGRLLIARGEPSTSSSQSLIGLSRYFANGTLDTSFGSGGIQVTSTIGAEGQRVALENAYSLWQTPDGGWTLVVDAYRSQGIGITQRSFNDKRVLRFTPAGQLDPTFEQGRRLESGPLAQRDDGTMLVAHSTLGSAGSTPASCSVKRLATDVPRVEATVVEYFHPALNHYFMTIEGFEVGILDDNRAAMGWVRTGKRFGAWAAAPLPGTTRLCRFYGDLAAGPNSHFYIPQGAGCEGLRQLEAQAAVGTKAWRLEGIVFSATEAASGSCPGSLAPVYRFYNRGYEQGKDSNHRYSTDPAVSAEMLAKGWASEGVAFCAPPVSLRQPQLAF